MTCADRAARARGPEPLLPAGRDQADARPDRPAGRDRRRGRASVRAPDRAGERPTRCGRLRLPAALRGPCRRQAGASDRGRGRHPPARGAGPADHRRASGRRRVPVAQPRPGGGAWAGRWPMCSTRFLRRTSTRWSARSRPGSGRPSAGVEPTTLKPSDPGHRGDGHQRQDHDVSDDRPHRPHCAGLHVGWSSTDGIYMRRGARRGRRLLGSERCGTGAGPARRAARRHRDGPGRHPAARHRRARTTTSRSSPTSVRRPPRHARASTRSTSSPRSRPWSRTSPSRTAGRCSTATTRGCSRCARRSSARPWVFTPRPRLARACARCSAPVAAATTVIDGWLCVLAPDSDPDPLVRVVDVPMTLAGLSRFNLENALAAASAALGAGLPREAVVEGLTSFAPGPELNPGRMNIYSPQGRDRHPRPGPQRGRTGRAARGDARSARIRRSHPARAGHSRRPDRRDRAQSR